MHGCSQRVGRTYSIETNLLLIIVGDELIRTRNLDFLPLFIPSMDRLRRFSQFELQLIVG